MLKETFLQTATRLSSAQEGLFVWQEIVHNYTVPSRHYHTLDHLASMLQLLQPLRRNFADWDMVVMALVYHDWVYEVSRADNEEQSANVALALLTKWNVQDFRQEKVVTYIMSTKTHHPADEETNWFTDADLGILGASPMHYQQYARQIRREYSVFKDMEYHTGRSNVLKHFLAMPRIFKSDYFHETLEPAARKNLAWELDLHAAGRNSSV
jgi:predicted metal-dependent HD superfamily phosphohydrolase